MERTSRVVSRGLTAAVLALGLAGPGRALAAPPDSCGVLTTAEIQAAVGKPVGEGKLNTKANPLGGRPCEYRVGDLGLFSVLVKPAAAGETPASVKAELERRRIQVSPSAALGEGSFFSSPGYGMVQLNTFKGPSYAIITLLVPGGPEAAQKAAAERLMRLVAQRL